MPLEVATAATPVKTEAQHVGCVSWYDARAKLAGTCGGCTDSSLTPLQRRDTFLKDIRRGVHQARVDVAQLFQTEELGTVLRAVEGERSALIERDGPRIGFLIGRMTRVDLDRLKLMLVLRHLCNGSAGRQ